MTACCHWRLQVLGNSDDGGHHGSLLWLLSQTLTAGGSRVLRRWVSHPLTQLPAITRRQDAVGALRDAVAGECDDPLLASLPAVLKVPRAPVLFSLKWERHAWRQST